MIFVISTELSRNASMRPNVGSIGLSIAWGTHALISMVFGGIGDLVISTELSRNASMRPNVGGIGLSIAWGTHDSIFMVFGKIVILVQKCL